MLQREADLYACMSLQGFPYVLQLSSMSVESFEAQYVSAQIIKVFKRISAADLIIMQARKCFMHSKGMREADH